ncbi:MAG: 3'-5' exonuclease [Gemmatimonadaceae bacterium]
MVAGDVPLDQLPFVVVDVETTGCSIWGGDRVTEVAAVEVQGGEVGRSWSTLIYPQRPIPTWITTLTGINDAMVCDAPPFFAVADHVRNWLDARVFVGHNAAFDWRFLDAELQRTTGDGFAAEGRRLCTVRLARVFLRRLERRSLDHLARYFGISINGRHRALGDAVATAHCLTQLLQAAQDAGLATLDDLDTYVAAYRLRRARPRRRRSFLPSAFEPMHIA